MSSSDQQKPKVRRIGRLKKIGRPRIAKPTAAEVEKYTTPEGTKVELFSWENISLGAVNLGAIKKLELYGGKTTGEGIVTDVKLTDQMPIIPPPKEISDVDKLVTGEYEKFAETLAKGIMEQVNAPSMMSKILPPQKSLGKETAGECAGNIQSIIAAMKKNAREKKQAQTDTELLEALVAAEGGPMDLGANMSATLKAEYAAAQVKKVCSKYINGPMTSDVLYAIQTELAPLGANVSFSANADFPDDLQITYEVPSETGGNIATTLNLPHPTDVPNLEWTMKPIEGFNPGTYPKQPPLMDIDPEPGVHNTLKANIAAQIQQEEDEFVMEMFVQPAVPAEYIKVEHPEKVEEPEPSEPRMVNESKGEIFEPENNEEADGQ